MSGSRSRRQPTTTVSIRAVSVLVEAEGEFKQAVGYLIALLEEPAEGMSQALQARITRGLAQGYRATSLTELEQALTQVDQQLHELLVLLEQVTLPPLSPWQHQLQLAKDWLGVCQGKIKVALTTARLDQGFRAAGPSSPMEH